MSKVILYIATSIDNYIARKDDGLDWLIEHHNPENIDYGYSEFYSKIGATIMGKNTYSAILGMDMEWPYGGISSYVVTKDRDFKLSTPDTHLLNSDISKFVSELKEKSSKDIWLIGGGQLITHFLNNDLLDKMIITIIPTIIGEGIPLFPNNPKDSHWMLSQAETFYNGVVTLTYDKK